MRSVSGFKFEVLGFEFLGRFCDFSSDASRSPRRARARRSSRCPIDAKHPNRTYPNILRFIEGIAQPIVLLPCHIAPSQLALQQHVPAIARADWLQIVRAIAGT